MKCVKFKLNDDEHTRQSARLKKAKRIIDEAFELMNELNNLKKEQMKEKKFYKRDNLDTGMMVLYRNGEYGKVMFNTVHGHIIVNSDDTYVNVYHFNDELNLKHFGLEEGNNYEIMAIYKPKNEIHNLSFKLYCHDLLWERTTEKPIVTFDGVEYSESTLRSIIKKATK